MPTLETLKKGVILFEEIDKLTKNGRLPWEFRNISLDDYEYVVHRFFGFELSGDIYSLDRLSKLTDVLDNYIYLDTQKNNDIYRNFEAERVKMVLGGVKEMKDFLVTKTVSLGRNSRIVCVHKDIYNKLNIKY